MSDATHDLNAASARGDALLDGSRLPTSDAGATRATHGAHPAIAAKPGAAA